MRSDTVTKPTPEMLAAIVEAQFGDDVFGEDPTVNELEDKVAAMTGKERAVFVPSGTMGNLIAVGTHCGRGDEVILGDRQHVYKHEAGGASALLGVTYCPVPNNPDGTMSLSDIRLAIKADDPHFPISRLVSLENTHNLCGGKPVQPDYIRSVRKLCDEHDLKLHVDGARIFNASAAMNLQVHDLLRDVHTASICLSKGVGCPVGSIVVGDDIFVSRARRLRKMVGGGMRQSGVLAACALHALDGVIPRLKLDHAKASRLAQGLLTLNGIFLGAEVESNIILMGIDPCVMNPVTFCDLMADAGILINYKGGYSDAAQEWSIRLVLHSQISEDMLDYVLKTAKKVLSRA